LTGFINAALIACRLTVIRVTTIAAAPDTTKTSGPIPIR
jgi:hypothetical protein